MYLQAEIPVLPFEYHNMQQLKLQREMTQKLGN
jgi:hypothetical protein